MVFTRSMSMKVNSKKGWLLIVGLMILAGLYGCRSQQSHPSNKLVLSDPRVGRGTPLPSPHMEFGSHPKVEEAQELVKKYPQSATAHQVLGGICALQGDYARSQEALTKSIAIDPLQLSAYTFLAMALRRGHPPDWTRAEKVLQQASSIAYTPEDRYRIQALLGNFYLRRHTALKIGEDLKRAEQAFMSALQWCSDSQDSAVAYGMGIIKARLKQWREAQSWFEKAVAWAEAKPYKAYALEGLANVLLMKGDRKRAQALIKEAKQVYPNYPAALWDTAGSGSLRLVVPWDKKALPFYTPEAEGRVLTTAEAQELVKRCPQSAIAHYELGRAAHARQEYEQAKEALKKSIALDPLLVWAYIGLARSFIYASEPDWAEAEATLLKLRELAYTAYYKYAAERELGNYYLDRHTVLSNPSDLEKAREAYLSALKHLPQSKDSSAAYGIGIAWARSREWAKAKPWFEKAVAWANRARDKAQALEALANLYAELGDRKQAQALLEQAKQTDPSYPAELWALSNR